MKATTVKINYCVVNVDGKSVHRGSLFDCTSYVDTYGADHPRRPLAVCTDVPGAYVVYPHDRLGEMLTDPGRLLSPQEASVVSKLAEAWNEFVQLNVVHADNVEEFRRAIHRAQHVVMARPVQRQFNVDEERRQMCSCSNAGSAQGGPTNG